MIHAVVLADESGSMSNVREDVIGGLNGYIEKLKDEKEGETHVSIFTFDLSGRPIVREICKDTALKNIPKITYDDYLPSGSTPLNDAVIETVKRVKAIASKDDQVVFCIYTDGYENASRASAQDVKEAIAKREKKGWDFVYLGANQDAWSVGLGLGISGLKLNTSETKVGTRSSFHSLANMTNTARRSVSTGLYSVGEGGTLAQAYGGIDKIDEEEVDEKPS